jgi:hypothetical protein
VKQGHARDIIPTDVIRFTKAVRRESLQALVALPLKGERPWVAYGRGKDSHCTICNVWTLLLK